MQLYYKLVKRWRGILILLLVAVGCQQEYNETYSFGEDEIITGSDTIVTYILNMTRNDGSFDDLIDDCSEICIVFPYSIKIREEEFEIISMEDLDKIVNDYADYGNNITIDYPVTIRYSDYTEESIPNRGELNKIQHLYNTGTGVVQRVSAEFVYPVKLNVYNELNQSMVGVNTTEDPEMFTVFNSIGELIVAYDYPFTVLNSDGDSVIVSNNKELLKELENSVE